MGLLTEGSPLSWEETKKYADHVRKHGVTQFINQFHKLKDRSNDQLKWGDEIEYMIVKFNHKEKSAKLSLRGDEILVKLQEKELANPDAVKSLWRPEYARYMIEGTPGKPYGCLVSHYNTVEANMRARREEVIEHLTPDESLLSLTSFPRLGTPLFTDPATHPTPSTGFSRSLFFPDDAIFCEHPRFRTLTNNIRERKGEKVIINIPIFKDTETKDPFVEDFAKLGDDGEAQRAAKPDHVYMDCMGFGMGCCCLQVTFQACNIDEARLLYDQLAPITPIMVALSAASPVHRGLLTDHDCRWNIIAASVDDRTREELGQKPLKENKFRINKSRYDSIDSYLSPSSQGYNDLPLVIDEELYQQLIDGGIDHPLAQHVAHLFIRDPVSLFSEKIHQDDQEDTDHFENIQSTNWQTMRFKPPPPRSSIGWRVEFRPCEVQVTDFENAAYVVFVVLLTRVILSLNLNFLTPISKVDENLQIAQKKNAVLQGRFWFRNDVMGTRAKPVAGCKPASSTTGMTSHAKEDGEPEHLTASGEQEYSLMSINEIINGTKDSKFPGLVPLINKYLTSIDVDADSHCTLQQYLKLIQKRASGELKTTARWIRDFVLNHPDYKHDSVVSESINYDLLSKIDRITKDVETCPDLVDNLSTRTREKIPSAVKKAEKSYRPQCPLLDKE